MSKLTKFKKFYFNFLPNALIILGIVLLIMSFGPLAFSEVWYYFKQVKNQNYSLTRGTNQVEDSPFARFLSTRPIYMVPVDTNFGLVIEKIGINTPIVADVSVTDPEKYNQALKSGIAHSLTSSYPSDQPGNVYLFAHASLNFWDLGKYATVFNLLRKLEVGDRIHVFYQEQTFVYEAVNKEVLDGWNTYPITRPVIEPILTLQTCDPPGTTINRLVVTAKLIEIHDKKPEI